MQFAEILYNYTADTLKKLARLCDCTPYGRKDELVRCIHRTMMKPDSLRQLWSRLDDLSKKAVATAYHNDGEFNQTAFIAQYGSAPARPKDRWGWYQEPILLDLFIHDKHLPADLMPLLADLVPPPDRFQLTGLAETPKTAKVGKTPVDLTCAETEQAGLHDLLAYLRLVDQGKIKISATSSRATGGSLKKLLTNLLVGDFLLPPENFRATNTIRPFGLDVFAQEAGLVTKARGRDELELSEAGREFYQTRRPDLLLEVFETWTQQGQFDELTRISGLKGLGSRGTHLTQAAARREAVIEALSWCPAGVWIDIKDFYRALKIWHFDFEVETSQYSNLYVGPYRDYGGLYGDAYWLATKGLYVNTVLWEYLGTIGALDLLYTDPDDADLIVLDFYYDDYISLYDGLRYFRINPLGAYLLGQAGEYIPSQPPDRALFAIDADLQLTLTGDLTPNDRSLLAQVAVTAGQGRYRLDTVTLLTALEDGAVFDHLADFLRRHHSGPLPAAASAWLDNILANSQAFSKGDSALLIKVATPELADLALADPTLRSLCDRLNSKTLVVPARKEKAFRARLKELGYILQ